ncbi:serine/threonine protein kinase [Candidatus Poribacteria bacterium]|nr:serine/threonine protein kinase [Candidatus Poribacteria bacterium]
MPVLSRDSRFTIIEEINRGSMGIIYKAQDRVLNEIVALKVLNDYLCSDPSAVERFKSEARAAKKLSHPYIVRIHDLYESDNKRFISMEYIEGTDLKRLLSERTTFTEEMVLYYFMQICDALSYAHKMGIVHRDIKPANIMITSRNGVKITDFGIAKILRGEDATKSGTAVIGTPLYMAPEQIIGDAVDPRTDLYSLGIMLYEMMSGNPPFYLGNIEYHHIHTAPPPLPERVSPRLREVIMKMISKRPPDRFQSVEDLIPAIKGG